MLASCRRGDHEECLQTVLGNPSPRKCSCGCHKQGRGQPEWKPTSREARVTSRQKSWNQHWYWIAFGIGSVEEYVDESIIEPPKDPYEILYGRKREDGS